MKQLSKISAILLGIVLGMDLSGLFGSARVVIAIEAERLIIGCAIILIVFEFFEGTLSRQVCRFVAAAIVGIAFRESTGLVIEACLLISIMAILAIVAVVTIKSFIRPEEWKYIFKQPIKDKLKIPTSTDEDEEDDDLFEDCELPDEEEPFESDIPIIEVVRQNDEEETSGSEEETSESEEETSKSDEEYR